MTKYDIAYLSTWSIVILSFILVKIYSTTKHYNSTNNDDKKQESVRTYSDGINIIRADNLRQYVYYLASRQLDGRKTGTENIRIAQRYAGKIWGGCGLKIFQQYVPSIRCYNVMAFKDGPSDEIIVIGAHLDHLGDGRLGADDNASGSAVVIELSRAFSIYKNPPKDLLFQLYTGEELGLVGSKYYCNHPLFPAYSPSIHKHILMLNFDMVGRYHGQNFLSKGSYSGGSDFASFKRKGVPVYSFFTGLHSDYHRVTDTPDKINYNGMQIITKIGFDVVWKELCKH